MFGNTLNPKPYYLGPYIAGGTKQADCIAESAHVFGHGAGHHDVMAWFSV